MEKPNEKQVTTSSKQVNSNGRGKDRNGREMHANSLNNLRKRNNWKPGESGNPKGSSISFRQKMMMNETCPFDGKGRTWLEALSEGGMRMSLMNPVALSNLQDRHEGKVSQPISGDKENPLQVEFDAKDKLLSVLNRLAKRAEEGNENANDK